MTKMGVPRLTEKEAKVLELLITGGEKYGLELVKESEGELKRGTIYVLLDRMGEKGYLESRKENDPRLPGMPRPRYKPTGLGEKAYRLHAEFEARGAEVFA